MNNYINPNPKKVSKEDLQVALKKASKNYLNYEQFVGVLKIILNTDRMSRQDETEMLQDVYVLYKEQMDDDVIKWAQQHFHKDEVTKDTHDFWLDNRGLMMYYLHTRTHKL